MTLPEMLDDLPQACDVKGYKESWIGYKLHIDAGDRDTAQLYPDLGLGE